MTMALNGITEAFLFAVSDQQQVSSRRDQHQPSHPSIQVRRTTVAHGVMWVMFGALSFQLIPSLGTSGIVIANSVVMCLRAAYALSCIRSFFASHSLGFSLSHCTPSLPVILGFMISGVVTFYSEQVRQEPNSARSSHLCCRIG